MAEGVLKPETWAAIDDPFDNETDDEEVRGPSHLTLKLPTFHNPPRPI